jgi:hypothetical protein
MQISVNSADLVKQLRDLKSQVERKMVNMVVGFAYNVALSASDNTPLGVEGRYDNLYELRRLNYGIEATPGFHMGAWRYTESGSLSFDPNIYAPEEAVGRVMQDARASYKIGDVFYIGAKGPAYQELENGSSGKAPDGIMRPAIQQLMSIYLTDLQSFYRSG